MDAKILSIDINGYKSANSRLDTVMGYDQVLVLDQGRLVEQGANIFFQISQIFEIFSTKADLWKKVQIFSSDESRRIPCSSHISLPRSTIQTAQLGRNI